LEGYRKRSSLLKSPWPVGRPLGVGAGRLLPRPSTLEGIVGNDGHKERDFRRPPADLSLEVLVPEDNFYGCLEERIDLSRS
jgi:hypothetical protein